MRINWRDLTDRVTITGVSLPWAGVQWTLDRTEQEKARRIIIYLEDRRVLYNSYNYEVPEHCIRSVTEMRQHLIESQQDAKPGEQLAISLRFMAAACRRFLDDANRPPQRRYRSRHLPPWMDEAEDLDTYLGMLRDAFGFHLCLIASAYQINISDELASILPALPDE